MISTSYLDNQLSTHATGPLVLPIVWAMLTERLLYRFPDCLHARQRASTSSVAYSFFPRRPVEDLRIIHRCQHNAALSRPVDAPNFGANELGRAKLLHLPHRLVWGVIQRT